MCKLEGLGKILGGIFSHGLVFFLGWSTVSNKITLDFGEEKHIEAYFTYAKTNRPTDFVPIMTKLIELVDNANKSIYLKAYALTHKKFCEALLRAAERGVEVRILLDHTYTDHLYKKLSFLTESQNENLAIYAINIAGIGHDKVVVVDGETVSTGSFNFSEGANSVNEENIVILKNFPVMASKYIQHWHRSFESAKTATIKPGKWTTSKSFAPWEKTSLPPAMPQTSKSAFESCMNFVYLITTRPLKNNEIEELYEAKNRGLDVRIICPKDLNQPLCRKIGTQIPMKNHTIAKGEEKVTYITDQHAYSIKSEKKTPLSKVAAYARFCKAWDERPLINADGKQSGN